MLKRMLLARSIAIAFLPVRRCTFQGFPGGTQKWRIPKGFRLKAQGCEGRATPGKHCRDIDNNNGVVPVFVASLQATTPLGLPISPSPLPGVARPSQPESEQHQRCPTCRAAE